MRQSFGEHGRAYWSAEFALILEKHGWLQFEQSEPEILADLQRLNQWAAVIVAWLPDEAWRADYVESLRAYQGVLLLEGPFPPTVEELLGIERTGRPLLGARGPLRFSEDARDYIDHRFGDTFLVGHRSGPDPGLELSASGDPNPLQLAPREAVTRPPGLARDAFAQIDAVPVSENAARAAASMTLAYRARFARNKLFFEDPVDDALALLACVRCLRALPGTGSLDEALRRLVREAAGSNRPPAPATAERGSLARAIWGVALVEAAAALDDSTFAERAKDLVADVRNDWGTPGERDPLLSRWRALLAIELADRSGVGVAGTAEVLKPFVPRDAPATPQMLWVDVQLREVVEESQHMAIHPEPWLTSVALGLQSSQGRDLCAELDGLGVPDLLLVLGTMDRSGHHAAAQRLWRVIVETLYDTRQGLFMAGSVVAGKLAPTTGFVTSPWVALGLLDAAGPIEIVDAPTRALESYTEEQLTAWTASPYSFQPYTARGSEPLVTLLVGEEERLAIWRQGRVIATSFQLLSHLVHVHTVEPLREPFSAFRSGDAIVLEYLLMRALGSALAEGDPQMASVATWPWDVRYALTIRHDVDRVLDQHDFQRLLEFERTGGLAVSWFWLPDRLEPKQLATLEAEPGHEIGLHAVRLDQKHQELNQVGKPLASPIVGEAIHGSGDGWLGHLSVRAAMDAGLLYTELAPPIADIPYARYPWVDAEGIVGADRIIGVTYNISIEGKLGTQPGSEGGPHLYRQLLNHPDLNFDRLQNWIAELPAEQRVSWTCEDVARWWQATHMSGSISIRRVHMSGGGSARFEISSSDEIRDLELRIPCRADTISAVSFDGAAVQWSSIAEPEHPGIRVRINLKEGVPATLVLDIDRSRLSGRSDVNSITNVARDE